MSEGVHGTGGRPGYHLLTVGRGHSSLGGREGHQRELALKGCLGLHS